MFCKFYTILCFVILAVYLNVQQINSEEMHTSMCTSCGSKRFRKCYKVVNYTQANWFGANDHCNSLGMRLATVENDQQQMELLKAISEVIPGDNVWIGGTNLANGDWVWAPNGKIVTYDGWYVGKPDDPTCEHCIEMISYVSGWNDKKCIVEEAFVCESLANSCCDDE